MTQAQATTLITREVAAEIGTSYRALDYWVRRGYLDPGGTPTTTRGGVRHRPDRKTTQPGSGFCRHWTPEAIETARTMARLVHAGIVPVVAARIIRGQTRIAPGIEVVVTR